MSGEITPAGGSRVGLTVCVIMATLMQALDTTIANVALPYMQGSVAASQDQIAWVLTSYIVAAAIMTPPTGFLAGRFGLKRLFLVAITGFTVASMLCGMAQSLNQLVLFRVMQGAFGASLVPLSQTVLIGSYSRERQGFAMALFGIGVMIGPVLGPVLGGLLTENYSWRYVFYINLPIGIIDLIGIMIFLPDSPRDAKSKLDWFGFGTLSIAIGSLQIVLDRGEELDWFGSGEIIIETVVAASAFYLFLVHTFTAKNPFVRPAHIPRPQLRRRHVVHRHRRPDLLRLDGVAAAVSPGADELSGGGRRPGDGTARRRHHDFHAVRRPHGRPRRHPHPGRRRIVADRMVVQSDDRLDSGYFAGDHHRRHHGSGLRSWLSVRAVERGNAIDLAGGRPGRRRRAVQPIA